MTWPQPTWAISITVTSDGSPGVPEGEWHSAQLSAERQRVWLTLDGEQCVARFQVSADDMMQALRTAMGRWVEVTHRAALPIWPVSQLTAELAEVAATHAASSSRRLRLIR